MPKAAITGEGYSLVASGLLLQRDYSRALFAADIAYFLGAASVALVWCKYHHDKIISGETKGDRIPFFLTAYKLSEYFKIQGYLEYEELATAMWNAAYSFQSEITKNVRGHVQHLNAAAKKYAGVQVTAEEGLKLITTMTKPAESIFPSLNSTNGTTESTHLLKDVSSPKYDGNPSNHHQDEVPVAGKQSIISKFFSCCFGGSGEE